MAPAAIQLSFLLKGSDCALSLHSSRTSCGIILSARVIPAGIMIISSTYPRTGIKSGIKSKGHKAYPIIAAIRAFAYQGTLGSL